MKKSRELRFLCYVIILFAIINSAIGLFYDNAGDPFYVKSVYEEPIKMFGNGIYAHESYFKAPIQKGTDAVTLFICVPLFLYVTVLLKKDNFKLKLFHLGLLSYFLYNAASLAFGVPYNNLFISYILYFSLTLIAFIFAFSIVNSYEIVDKIKNKFPHKATSIFMVLAGLSVFVWFIEIIQSLVNGGPISTMGINTTEPTFVIDLGVIAPAAFIGSYMVLKRKQLGYILSVVLLTLNAIIGILVTSQSIFQYKWKVFISVEEFIPYVCIFVVMSIVAILINIKALKNIM